MFIHGNCLTIAMPKFGKCAKGLSESFMQEGMYSIPFFHTLFQRPGPILIDSLAVIRKRLKLPPVNASVGEIVPGR